MSFKRYRIIFILIFMRMNGSFADQTTNAQPSDNNKEGRALFPRLEYNNEWQPVGRGDPLKEDPTFDYMPPVLDRVRYWREGASKNKNDILLLGVPSKKLSSIKQKEKFTYGPIKRTYYSPPYQHHFSSPMQHQQQQQQQQYLPQRLMPPPSKLVTDSYPTSTNHYQHHQQHHHQGWKTSGNVYNEPRPENSISHAMLSRPNPPPTSTATTKHPSNVPFLPTIPPADRSHAPSSTSPTSPMSTHNGHMMPSRAENALTETTKPLLQSLLRTETAAPFTKKPSSAYQIEYTKNIYNPEAINSMATSLSHATPVAFMPTRPTIRPMSMKTTVRTSSTTSTTTTAASTAAEQYVQPEMQAGWPVYNLIIEGHSKVKTYGLKGDDDIGNLPKIRPVQANENPVIERVTNVEGSPEFHVKHLKKESKVSKKTDEGKKSSMTSLLSLLEGSFGNLLSDENEMKRKTRRSVPDDEQREGVISVSFQVGEEVDDPPAYRKGVVISEQSWPAADKTR